METFRIVAHRGASGIVGEASTALSFERAMSLSCDFIETDLRICKNDTIVCFHDDHYQGKPLKDITVDELRELSGVEVPTFIEWLDQCGGKISLDIEVKESGFEKLLLQVLESYDLENEVILKSFSIEVLENLRALECSYPLGLLLGQCAKEKIENHLKYASDHFRRLKLDFISPHYDLVSETFFKKENFHGKMCLVWTVNDPILMHELLKYPIEGFITDRPDLALCVIGRPATCIGRSEIEGAISHHSDEELVAKLSYKVLSESARIDTRNICTLSNLADSLQDWIHAIWGPEAKVCLVYDADAHQPQYDDLSSLQSVHQTLVLKKRSPFDHLTPHMEYCEEVQNASKGFDGIIALGSGTINDICKYAAHENEQLYISCATAASMNGYTSGIAALLVDDLKSTLPCPPPVAVLVSPLMIHSSPLKLSQSGYADLLSKYVSVSDWKLASLVRGEDFDELPGDISGKAIEGCMEAADGIRKQNPESLDTLMRAITLSGFSMALAGSSAPASGGEHLISHYLDMSAYQEKKCPELHGLQVALGTLLTSRLYEILRDLDPENFSIKTYSEDSLESAHGQLWKIVKKTALQQGRDKDLIQKRLHLIQKDWSQIWKELNPFLKSHAEIKKALESAGVACSPEDYQIERKLMRQALIFAADIRDRYTVLHFARDCGVLESIADEVIETAFA
jgi:glycerol-1-phosphate dehydrogenase [NAD(P)+]